jgi:hypothetical protein
MFSGEIKIACPILAKFGTEILLTGRKVLSLVLYSNPQDPVIQNGIWGWLRPFGVILG